VTSNNRNRRFGGGRPSRHGRSGKRPSGSRDGRPSAGRDEESQEKGSEIQHDGRREWKPRGEGRDDRGGERRGPRREWKPRGEGRDDRRGPRREWKPRGEGRDERGGPRRDDRRGPRREWKPRGEGRDDRRGPRRDGQRDDRRPRFRDDRDDAPKSAAQQRRAEVFARKGPRKYGKDKPFADRQDRDERVVDEGSVRGKRFRGSEPKRAERRTGRDRGGSPFPTPPALDEPMAREVRKAVGDRRYDYVSRQLSRALVAYDAERYREALAVLAPVLEDLWLITDVRVLAGRLEYRAQHWKAAAEHLEFSRASDRSDMTNMPVLIDCYRALKRYELVDQLWAEMKELSPHPAVMAEGRISAAMSYADRGDVQTAIRIMTHGGEPRQVQSHHLMEWYVLGDLYDRAGDAVTAKKFFIRVAKHDTKYVDVEARLASLGE